MRRFNLGIVLKRTAAFLLVAFLVTTSVEVDAKSKSKNKSYSKQNKTTKSSKAKKKVVKKKVVKKKVVKKKVVKKKVAKKKKSTSVSRESSADRDIVTFAKRFIGTPYVFGGSSPKTGFDCSGFTSYVMRAYGVSLNRSARDQVMNGVGISRSQLKPGDLILFHTTRPGISHVGMYIGNGQFIHASSGSAKAVTISELNSSYYNTRVVACRRVLP